MGKKDEKSIVEQCEELGHVFGELLEGIAVALTDLAQIVEGWGDDKKQSDYTEAD